MTETRKTLYDISWQVTEPEYRKGKGLSYSTIARFHREGFDNLNKLFDKIDSPSLIFGSLVDTLLTGDEKEFEENYVVAEFPAVAESQVVVIKYLFDKYSDTNSSLEEISDNLIIAATEVLNFQKNWKPETRAKVIKENGSVYYDLLHLSIGKTLIGTQLYKDAQECVAILKTNPVTASYFNSCHPFETNIEKFYQLKFRGQYQNIELRCMADLIIVDHIKKTIQPIDLKTSFNKEWNFTKSFIKWGYWIQAQLYWYIIKQTIEKDPFYQNYTLLDYQFIVISNNSRIPLIWTYADTQKEVDCVYGKNQQIVCTNWRSIVKDLNYYLEFKPTVPKGITDKNELITWLNYE